ncbi:MAG: SDR family oxidoreductase [Bdellovibrionota bacterium]
MRIAIITGGSRGLGKSAALKLAAKGTDVILTYNSKKDEADKVVKEIEAMGRKAHALQLDVSNIKSFDAFSDSVKSVLKSKWNTDRFDALLNNAGIGMYGPIMETSEKMFDDLMTIHFKSVFFLTQKLLPSMRDGGRILNVSSGLARFSYPGYAAYASMKGAVEVMSRYMAVELGPRKIAVNVIAPGAIETDFGGGRVRADKDLNAAIASQTALGRVGLPDDIGDVMASLLSEEMGWVNGQRIEAAGGIHL